MDENIIKHEKELTVNEEDLIVSATNIKGDIIYANEIFCTIAGYERDEPIGKPHSIIRHPDMPKIIFKLLWKNVLDGKPIYAFVKNKTKNGGYYWVKAYVKPIVKNGEIEQIISYRKPINDFTKEYIVRLYAQLVEYEKSHSIDESLEFFLTYLKQRNITYEQFIDRLSLGKSVENVTAMNFDLGSLRNAHLLFKQQIVTDLSEDKKDVEVVGSCCCSFGKWLNTIGNESFTKTEYWKKVILNHDKIHQKMQNYVDQHKQGVSKEILNSIVVEVENDVQTMFENLAQTVDTSKE